jgi:hypothetical protein
MGKIRQGILGGVSGKIANVVGGSWKGINYLRSLPVSVANPRTTPQVAQRGKLAGAVKVSKPILGAWIKPLFDRFAIQQSGYNVWVSENIENMDRDGYLDASTLIMAKGSMAPVPQVTADYTPSSGEMFVNWSSALPDNLSAATDQIYIAIASQQDTVLQYAQFSGSVRSTEEASIIVGQNQNAADLFVYVAARNAEGLRVSAQAVVQAQVA